jgi:hypothetical protein
MRKYTLIIATLLLAIFNRNSNSCFAQQAKREAKKDNLHPKVTLVKDWGKEKGAVPVAQIIADPSLKSLKPDLKVASYMVSFAYTQDVSKEQMYVGPFTAVGGALPQQFFDQLKTCKTTGGRIFFEQIVLEGSVGEVKSDPLILDFKK